MGAVSGSSNFFHDRPDGLLLVPHRRSIRKPVSRETMSSELKPLSDSAFENRLRHWVSSASPGDSAALDSLTDEMLRKLLDHYRELIKWNRRVSLVGPGAADEIVESHYADSLLGSSLIGEEDRYLVDVGSGGGFPGLILAICRPDLQVTLVEPRQKKWAFLTKMSKQLGLSSIAVNARVGRPIAASLKLPKTIDIVTSRALVISPEIFRVLAEYAPRARFLFWQGRESFRPPVGYRQGRVLDLPSGSHRRIVEVVPENGD